MATPLYWIDWDDRAFPKIKRLPYDPGRIGFSEDDEGMTFGEERVAADRPPAPSLIEKRAAKAEADLARWERKLKLATTKVKFYRRKVARYAKNKETS